MGLLDDPSVQAQMALGMGLLGGGNFGQAGMRGLMGYQEAMNNAQDRATKKAYTDAQMENFRSEIGLRNQQIQIAMRKQSMIQALMGHGGAGGTTQSPDGSTPQGVGSPIGGSMPTSGGGLLGGATSSAVAPQSMPQGQPLLAQGQSAPQQYQAQPQQSADGVSPSAKAFDLAFNDGKNIAGWQQDQYKPQWQKIGESTLVNTNAPGFAGGIQNSTFQGRNGQLFQQSVDPKTGQASVNVVPGSVDAYGQFAKMDANIAAGNDLQEVYNPSTGRKEFKTRAQVRDAANGGQRALQPMAGGMGNIQSSGYSGGNRDSANADSIWIMQRELNKPNLPDADRAAIQREIGRLQMQGASPAQGAQQPAIAQASTMGMTAPNQSGAMAAGPSLQETATQAANQAAQVDTAKAGVVRDTGKIADAKRFGQMQAGITRAIDILNQGPTASGFGSMADKTANFIGKSTKGADLASQLETLSGSLVQNVPRMEGPQSDKDVANYQLAAGRVGDRTIPISQRLAAAQEVVALQQKYAELNGLKIPGNQPGNAPGNAPAQDAPKLIDSLPTANASNKGKRARDSTTGKILISNGMQWVPQ